jgi:hypothetical protein
MSGFFGTIKSANTFVWMFSGMGAQFGLIYFDLLPRIGFFIIRIASLANIIKDMRASSSLG